MSTRLDVLLADVIEWQRATFPGERLVPAAIHLMRELDEIARDPTNGEEYADALMLVTCVLDRAQGIREWIEIRARQYGIDLIRETEQKLAINRVRQWGAPDDEGVVSHIRERKPWDEYWFDEARLAASRATCPRAAIGAVLVRFKRIISKGFNGAPEGELHCLERNTTLQEHLDLTHCPWSIHAEQNCLRNAWSNPYGATLYVVGPRDVCIKCAERLQIAGVTDIRWRSA
jgi:dCMP deaminase